MKKKVPAGKRREIPSIVDIDVLNLDKEWVQQPKLFWLASVELAEARMEYSDAKTAVEIARAKIENEIRSAPETFIEGKVTEPAIKAAVAESPKLERVAEILNEAKFKVDLLEAKVGALEMKKKALENLVHLFSLESYAQPRARGASAEKVRNFQRAELDRRMKVGND